MKMMRTIHGNLRTLPLAVLAFALSFLTPLAAQEGGSFSVGQRIGLGKDLFYPAFLSTLVYFQENERILAPSFPVNASIRMSNKISLDLGARTNVLWDLDLERANCYLQPSVGLSWWFQGTFGTGPVLGLAGTVGWTFSDTGNSFSGFGIQADAGWNWRLTRHSALYAGLSGILGNLPDNFNWLDFPVDLNLGWSWIP